jgi:hypothetical protein
MKGHFEAIEHPAQCALLQVISPWLGPANVSSLNFPWWTNVVTMP